MRLGRRPLAAAQATRAREVAEFLARTWRRSTPYGPTWRPGYLSELEHGTKRNPSVAIVQRLAKALGVPVMRLLE